jgi:hypothetical protein
MRDGLEPAPGNTDTAANTEDRHAAPPSSGFGPLWEKTFRMVLQRDISPEELMARWKAGLHELWPDESELYVPARGIREGEMAGIDLSVGPGTLSTGVLVTEAGPTSFTLQSPEGHMFAGRNRFSTERAGGHTVAQVQVLFRANDPLYDLGLMLGGHRVEERFWADVLHNLAALYGERPTVHLRKRRLDRRRQWRHAGNIWQNAAIRTMVRRAARWPLTPFRHSKEAR